MEFYAEMNREHNIILEIFDDFPLNERQKFWRLFFDIQNHCPFFLLNRLVIQKNSVFQRYVLEKVIKCQTGIDGFFPIDVFPDSPENIQNDLMFSAAWTNEIRIGQRHRITILDFRDSSTNVVKIGRAHV